MTVWQDLVVFQPLYAFIALGIAAGCYCFPIACGKRLDEITNKISTYARRVAKTQIITANQLFNSRRESKKYSLIFHTFQVFCKVVQLLWPSNDLQLQVCCIIPVLHMLAARFVQLRTPQELGMIVHNLSQDKTKIPWKNVGLWVIYRFLDSWGGLRLVVEKARRIAKTNSTRRVHDLIFCHVMALSMDFHHNKATGELLKVMDKAKSFHRFIEYTLEYALPTYFDCAIIIAWIFYHFGTLMSLILAPLGVVNVWTRIWTYRQSSTDRQNSNKALRRATNIWFECISNWDTVSNFNNIPHERQRYQTAIKSSIETESATAWPELFALSIQSLQVTFGLSVALIYAAWQVKTGQISVDKIITLLMYWESLVRTLGNASDVYRGLSIHLTDVERILQLLQETPSVKEGKKNIDFALEPTFEITFQDVGFSYDSRACVLQNIKMMAKRGDSIAIVGETGAGKSTIFKLILRHYDVTLGHIAINGHVLNSLTTKSIRQAISVVPQHVALFNNTIMENVRYARLSATNEEVEQVCRLAAIHKSIVSFPEGYQTIVGERGVKLSGGELQRIGLARVFLKDSPILLLDEATSAVDTVTESYIQDSIRKFRQNRITFIIAHRFSTITTTKFILVLDNGEIVESGTHQELVERNGKYFELWSKQVNVE